MRYIGRQDRPHVTLWSRYGAANDRIHRELLNAGYEVERYWSAEREPAVSNGAYFSRGYGDIYERFLSSPVGS